MDPVEEYVRVWREREAEADRHRRTVRELEQREGQALRRILARGIRPLDLAYAVLRRRGVPRNVAQAKRIRERIYKRIQKLRSRLEYPSNLSGSYASTRSK